MVACSLNCNCSYLGFGLTDCLYSSPLEERILPVSVRALPRHPPWLCEFSHIARLRGSHLHGPHVLGRRHVGRIEGGDEVWKALRMQTPSLAPQENSPWIFFLPVYSFQQDSREASWCLAPVSFHSSPASAMRIWLLGVHPAPLNNLQAHQYLLPEYCRISLLLLCPLHWGRIRMTFSRLSLLIKIKQMKTVPFIPSLLHPVNNYSV